MYGEAWWVSMAWTARIFGWLSAAAARASCSNRARRSRSAGRPEGMPFSATSRPSFVSRARYTSPMPPAPMAERISYGPRRVPPFKDINLTSDSAFSLLESRRPVLDDGDGRRGGVVRADVHQEPAV